MSYATGASTYSVMQVSFEGFSEVVRKIQDYRLILNEGPPGLQEIP